MTNLNDSDEIIYNDEINILELILVLWKRKFLIVFLVILSGFASIQYALSLPNFYRSSALLTSASGDGGQSALSRFGGMASLAGISLPAQKTDKTIEGIERIKSFEFFNDFFLPNILLQDLMAVKTWNPQSNEIFYIDEIYNADNDKWIRSVSFPRTPKPSSQEAYKEYKKMMNISQDSKTSFISISIKHQSPFIAEMWVNVIVDEINQSMRNREKEKVIKSINFLNTQLEVMNYDEIKQSISSLQQEQIKSLMMIESSEEYIFKTLSSPVAPELKYEPKRSRIVIFGTVLGGIISAILVLALHYLLLFRNRR